MTSHRAVGPWTVAVSEGSPESDGNPAYSPIYRNSAAANGWPTGPQTLYDMFQQSVKKYGIEPCLGHRPITDGVAGPYVWATYREVDGTANKVLGGLRHIGVAPGDRTGVYAPNCPEWTIAIQAANRGSNGIVPLYDSLGEDAVSYTAKHSGMVAIFVVADKMASLVAAGPAIRPGVRSIVYWGSPQPETAAKLKALGFAVYFWDDFLVLGERNPAVHTPPEPDTIATIMYTSGTTGTPKGVVLTHANVVAAVLATQNFIGHEDLKLGPGDVFLSFLTLAHIFGRLLEETTLSLGGCIGYWQGDVRKLNDDIMALRPTVFAAVPRILERFDAGIKAKISKSGWFMRFILDSVIGIKIKIIKTGIRTVYKATPILDWLLFNKIRAGMGGRLRYMFSGGAPLSPAVADYLEACLCCPIMQGYGLTETCAVSFVADPYDLDKGSVGSPTTAIEFRFEGSSDLGYDPLGTPPQGEVCIRGPAIFSGYYKDPEKTEQAFDREGFFHTGDVGQLTADGTLKIIDRIKNMFKLAQGEYVAAEKLETLYTVTEIVDQIWVYGDSLESFLVAVVVPEKRCMLSWAKAQGLDTSDYKALVVNPKAAEYVVKELAARGKAAKVKGFEAIAAVHLDSEHWTVEADLMTPSFKLKRPALKKKYADTLAQLYADAKSKAKK